MPEMGKYCKAYYAKRLREFEGFKENTENLRALKQQENGREVELERTSLRDEDVLYLQENYVVTDGIFKDQNVVFDDVTDAWKAFCTEVLDFHVPEG